MKRMSVILITLVISVWITEPIINSEIDQSSVYLLHLPIVLNYPTTFWVMTGAGDIADCLSDKDESTASLLDNIDGLIYTLGDNAYNKGLDVEFANCYDPTWGRHKARTKPAPGNHDYGISDASGYFYYFGEASGDPDKGYYSYNYGDWHIIVLNSECEKIDGCGRKSSQGRWLQADLQEYPTNCTMAYWHRPLFTSSSVHPNDPDMRDFWNLLYESSADVVLNGHNHHYERFSPQDPNGTVDLEHGIREFIVGTGGRNLYPFGDIQPNSEIRENNTHGVLKLTLHPSSYDWEFIPIEGSSFTDYGSALCNSPSSQTASN